MKKIADNMENKQVISIVSRNRKFQEQIVEQSKNKMLIYAILIFLAAFSFIPVLGLVGTFLFIFVWIRYLLRPKMKLIALYNLIATERKIDEKYTMFNTFSADLWIFTLGYLALKIIHLVEDLALTLGAGVICTGIFLPVQLLFIFAVYWFEKKNAANIAYVEYINFFKR